MIISNIKSAFSGFYNYLMYNNLENQTVELTSKVSRTSIDQLPNDLMLNIQDFLPRSDAVNFNSVLGLSNGQMAERRRIFFNRAIRKISEDKKCSELFQSILTSEKSFEEKYLEIKSKLEKESKFYNIDFPVTPNSIFSLVRRLEKEKEKFAVKLIHSTGVLIEEIERQINDNFSGEIKELKETIKEIISQKNGPVFEARAINSTINSWLDNTRIGREITILELAGKELEALMPCFGKFPNLRALNLQNNKLSKLPKGFSRLGNLIELNLSNNKFDSVPNAVLNVRSLQALNLNDNQLNEIPKEIEYLRDLKVLALSNNRLIKIPSSLKRLQNLNLLDISGNDKLFEKRIFKRSFQAPVTLGRIGGITRLEKLYLSKNQLENFPNFYSRFLPFVEIIISE